MILRGSGFPSGLLSFGLLAFGLVFLIESFSFFTPESMKKCIDALLRNVSAPPSSPYPSEVRNQEAGPPQLDGGDDDSFDDEPIYPTNPKAYLALMGCFFLMFNSWGLINSYGVFVTYYTEFLTPKVPLQLISMVGSTESFALLLLSFVVGRLLDAGYYQYLTGAGTLLVSIGMFTLSVANGQSGYGNGKFILIWVTQGLVVGLGMACFFISSSQIVSTWFAKRRSFAIGIVACGASIAGVIYPVVIDRLIPTLGFDRTTQCVAGITTGTALISFIFARPNPNHRIRKPESWKSVRTWVDTHAFRNQAYVWYVASVSVLFFGFYAIFFNLIDWAIVNEIGYKKVTRADGTVEKVPPHLQQYWLLIMNGSSSLGRLSAAYLSDHFGAVKVHAITTGTAGAFVLLLWTLGKSIAATMAFVILFGAVSGAVIGLPPASVSEILGPSRAEQTKLGQWTGVLYTVAAPFSLAGPMIASYLVRKFNAHLSLQLWSGLCLVLSSLCMAVVLWKRKKMPRKSASTTATSLASSVRDFSLHTRDEEEIVENA